MKAFSPHLVAQATVDDAVSLYFRYCVMLARASLSQLRGLPAFPVDLKSKHFGKQEFELVKSVLRRSAGKVLPPLKENSFSISDTECSRSR